MKSIVKKFLHIILKVPLPSKFLYIFEEFILNYQGKGIGWDDDSIKNEVKACLSLINNKPLLFLDIGANKGRYTNYLLQKFPKLECHLFEPSYNNYEFFLKKKFTQKNIIINNFGLSDCASRTKLFSDKSGSGLASLTKRRLNHFNIEMNFEEEILLKRLDLYWEDNNKIIDYVKIDVEGHELDVLKGFGDLVFSTKLIQFEFGGCNIDTRTYFQDFWYFFKEKNFKLYRITPRGVIKIKAYNENLESFLTTNYIALNSKFY